MTFWFKQLLIELTTDLLKEGCHDRLFLAECRFWRLFKNTKINDPTIRQCKYCDINLKKN